MGLLRAVQMYLWLVNTASLNTSRHQNCLELNMDGIRPHCLLLPLSIAMENFLPVLVQAGLSGLSVVLVALQKKTWCWAVEWWF